MRRAEVSTPWLEAQLAELDAGIARRRRNRHDLLHIGNVIAELERNPDLWVTLVARTPESSPIEVTALIHLPPQQHEVQDLVAWLRHELGEPYREIDSGTTLNITWRNRGQAVFQLIVNEFKEIRQ